MRKKVHCKQIVGNNKKNRSLMDRGNMGGTTVTILMQFSYYPIMPYSRGYDVTPQPHLSVFRAA